MSRHCEHCTFWKGNEGSSRAECGNDDVMGTTAHNDTCKHFTAKSWLTNATVKIDDAGKIIPMPGGGLIWAGAGVPSIVQGNADGSFTIPANTPMYIMPDGKYTTTPNGNEPDGHVISTTPASIFRSDDTTIGIIMITGTSRTYKLSDTGALRNYHEVTYCNTSSSRPTRSILDLMSELNNHARRMNMTLLELIEWAGGKSNV